MKYKILDKISAEEALKILRRLAEKDQNIARQIESTAKQVLKKADLYVINVQLKKLSNLISF